MKGKKPKVKKTKVGTEYRVRNSKGEIHGEFNSKSAAKGRKKKIKGGMKGGKK